MPNEKKEEEDKENKAKDPYQKYKDFQWSDKDAFKNGPVGDSSRSCRDVLCLIIFLLFIGGCIVVAVFAFKDGKPNLILYPYDEDSNQCGTGNQKNYPFLYFYSSISNLKSLNLSGIVNSICIDICPNATYTERTTPITLKCIPTKTNPSCLVSFKDYYRSQGSKPID